ncbi:hypothetical protein ES703_42397 [subsurface metagenome]
MVIILSYLSLFIISIKAAIVVDFPLPVGPVTNTNPLSFSVKLEIIEGKFNSERLLIFSGINLKAPPSPRRCLKTFILKRPTLANS